MQGLRFWTEWDTRAFARGLAVAALALGLVAIVTGASDEGGLGWGVRAGRTLPLAPVCAAIGAWLALAPARARGDERALATLGRSPWERHVAAIAGGAAVAVTAAIVISAVPRVDVRGFYPRAEEAVHWRHDGAAFVSEDGRWRIGAEGEPTFVRAPTPAPAGEPPPDDARSAAAEAVPVSALAAPLPPGARASAALATALAGFALPMIAARAQSRRAIAVALGVMGIAALATVLAFQAAAASRAPALLASVPPLLLLAWAASRYRSGAWSRAKFRR